MKKSVAAALAVLLLLAVLASCGGKKEETGTTAETTGAPSAVTELVGSVEKKNYDGATFGFLTIGSSERYCKEILPADEDESDPIYASVLQRNRYVEDYLGIKLQEYASDDPINDAVAKIGAGDESCDVYNIFQHGCMNLVSLGYTRDWNELDIDYRDPWWNEKATAGLSINGHLPVMSGSILISEIEAIVAMVYNQGLYEEYRIDADIYKEVLDGEWTLDRFIALSSKVNKDVDGDGNYDIGNDILGYAADPHSMAMNWSFASGLVNAEIKDGVYKPNVSIEKTVTLLEKLKAFFESTVADQSMELLDGVEIFKDNKIFIYAVTLYNLEYLRSMNVDYGIIPYPKFDETQKNYVTHVGGAAPIMLLPYVTTKDTAFLSDVLSALCECSYKTVRPAYYDVTLREKGTRDEQSKEVLDLLLDARVYDFAYINCTGYAWTVGNMIFSGDTNFERIWTRQGERQIMSLQAIIDDLIAYY